MLDRVGFHGGPRIPIRFDVHRCRFATTGASTRPWPTEGPRPPTGEATPLFHQIQPPGPAIVNREGIGIRSYGRVHVSQSVTNRKPAEA